MVTLAVEGRTVTFNKIETGADVSVMPLETFKAHCRTILLPPEKTMKGPDRQPLRVVGQFRCRLGTGQKEVKETMFVVENVTQPLLGRIAIENLALVSRIHSVATEENTFVSEYPEVFSGLGNLREEYTIRLQDAVKPYALSTPRRIALPLLKRVNEEPVRMESLDVIAPVKEPTDWCSPMVVVPKQNGQVRICVDLTKLNQCVKRERLILPSVEDTLAKLSSAKVFTKLDANSGFWQVPLSAESAPLTTFITPFGRYPFKRLPFGISYAPEYFQKKMSEVLEGLSGVACMMDDILVFGSTKEEHDRRLHRVLQAIRAAGATLNKSKCVF